MPRQLSKLPTEHLLFLHRSLLGEHSDDASHALPIFPLNHHGPTLLMTGSIYACSAGNSMSVGATVSSPFRLSPVPLRIPRVSLMVRSRRLQLASRAREREVET